MQEDWDSKPPYMHRRKQELGTNELVPAGARRAVHEDWLSTSFRPKLDQLTRSHQPREAGFGLSGREPMERRHWEAGRSSGWRTRAPVLCARGACGPLEPLKVAQTAGQGVGEVGEAEEEEVEVEVEDVVVDVEGHSGSEVAVFDAGRPWQGQAGPQ
ncbi:hypothetical protein N431DRAFT_450933 [Stipitochalara longipes BDJ]|nr:hypothetical protein N431DRAFT_450933 [Stipitochalara longipes BDJ]